jgi:hypothetical protein
MGVKMETEVTKTEIAKALVFEYKIGFFKNCTRYKLNYYSSPYKNSEQELDDINVIMDGKDLQGNSIGLKVVNWEKLEDNTNWEAIVTTYFTPNGDGSYDQLFKLKSLDKKQSSREKD